MNVDEFTTLDGRTVNWGYQNNSQYSSADNTMTYRRTTVDSHSVSVGTDLNTGFSEDEHFDAAGPAIRLNCDLLQREDMILSLALDLRAYWGMEQSLRGSTFRQTVNEKTHSVVDAYVFGTDPESEIPPAPYNGGSFDGPLINNLPTSATRADGGMRSSTWHAANAIDIDIDSDLYQIGLGPQFGWQAAPRLRVNVTPSVFANYVSMDVTRREEFVVTYGDGGKTTLNSWQDDYSHSQWAVGLGIQGGVEFALTDAWALGLDAGYEYVDEVSIDCGPNKVTLDLSAYTVSASLAYRF